MLPFGFHRLALESALTRSALVGHGRFVLKERLTPGSWAIMLDAVGVTVGVFILALATPIPGRDNVLRFVRRTITGGPAYAGARAPRPLDLT